MCLRCSKWVQRRRWTWAGSAPLAALGWEEALAGALGSAPGTAQSRAEIPSQNRLPTCVLLPSLVRLSFLLHHKPCVRIRAASLENDVSSLSRSQRLSAGFGAIREVSVTLMGFSRAETKPRKRQPTCWKLRESWEVWGGRKVYKVGLSFSLGSFQTLLQVKVPKRGQSRPGTVQHDRRWDGGAAAQRWTSCSCPSGLGALVSRVCSTCDLVMKSKVSFYRRFIMMLNFFCRSNYVLGVESNTGDV